MANGFSIQRQWFTPDGKPITGDVIEQGDLVVVTHEGQVAVGANYRALLIDLLPAGFEIEKARLDWEYDANLDWLPNLSRPRYTDGRDDRYVVAFDTENLERDEKNKKMKTYRAAYLMRAVTPGDYILPPVEVEDMYRPEYRARTGAKKVRVVKE